MDSLFFIGLFLIPAAIILLIVWFNVVTKRKRYELQAEMYTKALEHGQSAPPDLFAEPKPQRKFKPLNVGIICLFFGIGVFLYFWFAAILETAPANATDFRIRAPFGIIPFFIGIAFVIIHFITKTKSVNENTQ